MTYCSTVLLGFRPILFLLSIQVPVTYFNATPDTMLPQVSTYTTWFFNTTSKNQGLNGAVLLRTSPDDTDGSMIQTAYTVFSQSDSSDITGVIFMASFDQPGLSTTLEAAALGSSLGNRRRLLSIHGLSRKLLQYYGGTDAVRRTCTYVCRPRIGCKCI